MGLQSLNREQLKEELNLVFEQRIKHLKDEIGRRERTPYSDPGIQKAELAKFAHKLAIAIVAQHQLQDLIKENVKT